ncbi:SidA/IucD/PvdA family monooxygenase (plasmid) [Bacillus mycoides]|nr:SidA/IucD/PvdA family monooxygenase [Bacillus mycoides]
MTTRNPTSHFAFLNYLKYKQRIQDFINLSEFYHFSQEDSFLKEREVSRWEMNWLRTSDGRMPS